MTVVLRFRTAKGNRTWDRLIGKSDLDDIIAWFSWRVLYGGCAIFVVLAVDLRLFWTFHQDAESSLASVLGVHGEDGWFLGDTALESGAVRLDLGGVVAGIGVHPVRFLTHRSTLRFTERLSGKCGSDFIFT